MGAALRYSALDGLRPPAVTVTGMGLAAVDTYRPTLADSALRRRRLLFVACGDSDAPVSFIGYSAGGSIAAVLADEHPELVWTYVAGGDAGTELPLLPELVNDVNLPGWDVFQWLVTAFEQPHEWVPLLILAIVPAGRVSRFDRRLVHHGLRRFDGWPV